MWSTWTKGTWTAYKDTIYFKMVPVYDTIRHTGSNGQTLDSLQLSDDEMPELLNPQPTGYFSGQGQNREPYPEKLFFRKDRLYNIDSGKLIRKKVRSLRRGKKYAPWYLKEGVQ
jgi:hypothetical protein